MRVGCLRVCVVAAIAAASAWSCSLVSGVDKLQKVQCVSVCEGGIPAGPDGAGGSSTYRAAVLADSPVGYWRLGDAAGSTTCHDETGHGHDGAVIGGVTLGARGALANDTDTAARFDGTSGTIDLGTTFTFTAGAPFSWEVWVKPSVLDASYRPFLSSMTFDNQGNPVDGSYMVAYSVGRQTFGFERYRGGTSVIAIDTGDLQANAWTYIVATSDATGHGVVYVNGVPSSSDVNQGSVPAYAASTILGTLLRGELDEVAIYDHPLSAAAVAAHWSAASQ